MAAGKGWFSAKRVAQDRGRRKNLVTELYARTLAERVKLGLEITLYKTFNRVDSLAF